MSFETYLIYISISIAYILSPGPGVFLVINYAAMYGIKKTLLTLMGNSTGLGILAYISAIGIGIIIINSPLLGYMIKLFGSIVLLWLGLKMLFSFKQTSINQPTTYQQKNKTHITFYKEGIILALTNPKPIIFFTSIYPQFITNQTNQNDLFTLLGLSFMILSFIGLSFYAILSKYTLGKILDKKNAQRFNLISGLLFIIMALSLFLQN